MRRKDEHTAGDQPRDEALVTGRVVIAATIPPFESGVAHVRLEEVSFADAPSTTIAETVIRGIDHKPRSRRKSRGETVFTFELRPSAGAPAIEERNDYAVRVWIDCDGDGKPSAGDLFSDESYPVLTRGFGRAVTIRLGSREDAVETDEQDESE